MNAGLLVIMLILLLVANTIAAFMMYQEGHYKTAMLNSFTGGFTTFAVMIDLFPH